MITIYNFPCQLPLKSKVKCNWDKFHPPIHLPPCPLCLCWLLVHPCTLPSLHSISYPHAFSLTYRAPFAPQSVCHLLRVAYPVQPVKWILHVLLYPPCATLLTHFHQAIQCLSCILLDSHNPSHRPSSTHAIPLTHHRATFIYLLAPSTWYASCGPSLTFPHSLAHPSLSC